MKKIIAILPPIYNWPGTAQHALAFGVSAALMIGIIPALCRALNTAISQVRGALSPHETSLPLFLKVFGQRR